MTKRVWLTVFALALIVSLAATVPLRFVLPNQGFTARNVTGTIWAGNISQVVVKGFQINDLRIGVRGWGSASFTSPSSMSGIFHLFSRGLKVEKLSGRFQGRSLIDYLDHGEVQNVHLHLGTSGCIGAGGLVRLQLDKQIGGLPMGQMLTGTPRCKGQNLSLMLASQSRQETLAILVRPDESYVATYGLGPTYAEHQAVLLSLGFEQTALGFQLRKAGKI
jgi:general secretion pathway protein N